MAFDAARYTTGMRYDPTLNTGRYPGMPAVGPLAPPTTDPVVARPQALPTPPPAPQTPVSAGSVPLDAGGEGMQGGGVDPLGGMPGPSPDQSLDAMGRAALMGLGFAVSPMSSFAGMLASLTYDGMKGNLPGTTRGLLGIARNELGLGGKGDLGEAIAEGSLGGGVDGGAKADTRGDVTPDNALGGYGGLGDGSLSEGGTGPDGGDKGGGGGGLGDGSLGEGGTGPDGGSKWQSGGYTGAGDDAMVQPDAPAGTVHEGEVVLSAPAVDYYGPELLLLLNDMAIPRSRLAALVRGE